MAAIRKVAQVVEPTRTVSVSPDESGNRFLECAEAANADWLVTGNTRHFPQSHKATKVVTGPPVPGHPGRVRGVAVIPADQPCRPSLRQQLPRFDNAASYPGPKGTDVSRWRFMQIRAGPNLRRMLECPRNRWAGARREERPESRLQP
jgi:hypothetical protein